MYKILIVEDDVAINRLLVQMLQSEYEVSTAFSGSEAQLLLEKERPDLILLDLMLPGLSGEELLSYIRNEKQLIMPVLILSAKSDVDNKVQLLKHGADDYVIKPFDPMEVIARIEVALRRVNQTQVIPTQFTYKNLTLFTEYRKIVFKEHELHLTAHEYEILALFIQNPRKVYSRDVLYAQVWGGGYYGENNTVNVHISNIRKKLNEIDSKEEYIQTVYGIGFKLQ